MLDQIETLEEVDNGSRDVGQREGSKDRLDLLSLVFELPREVLVDVLRKVDVG